MHVRRSMRECGNEWMVSFSWLCLCIYISSMIEVQGHKVVPLCHAKKLFLPFKRLSTWHRGGRLRLLRLPGHHGTCGADLRLQRPSPLLLCSTTSWASREWTPYALLGMVYTSVSPTWWPSELVQFSASCISSLRATIANFWQHCGFTPTKPALPS